MNKATVATPSPRMAELATKRELVNTLMGGTFAMRAAKTKYLPKHPAESDGVYETRLQKTFLDNFLDLAVAKACGKVFKKQIMLKDVPPQLEELLDDVDLQGSGLDPFAQEVGRQSLASGISYILVDVPPSNGAKTAAEERAAGIRPYLVHIKPDSVLEILSERVNGKESLKRVRLKESVEERDGDWGFKTVDQVRVLEMREGVMCYDVYREHQVDGAKKEWVKQPDLSGVTTFPAIFLVPFYSNRVGFMIGEPGFQNIAESTLEHWQVKSEYMHALTMSCFCMYTASGVPDGFIFEVGPTKTLAATDPNANFGVIETTGKGVELAERALAGIESRIETSGVNLRVENAGKVTATAASLDSAETNAGLMAVAQNWSDSWELVLYYMASILGVDSKAEVEVCTDFGGLRGTQAGLTELGKARQLGDISREQYLGALIWRGELQEDFDLDANEEELASEGPALGIMGGVDANTGA